MKNKRTFPDWLAEAGVTTDEMADIIVHSTSRTSIEAFLSWSFGLSPETYNDFGDLFDNGFSSIKDENGS